MTGAGVITVAAVDDHDTFLEGVRSVVSQQDDMTFAHAHPSIAAWVAAGRPRADVTLLDVQLPGEMDVAANVTALLAAGSKVALHTHEVRVGLLGMGLAAGATGVVLKGDPSHRVVEAVRAIAAGETYHSSTTALVLSSDPRAHLKFAPRELETLRLIAKGLPRASVARRLNITTATIRTYLDRAAARYAEIGVSLSGAMALTAEMERNGYIVDDDDPGDPAR
ncbi:LuxR C-terminal-related transcriptional regulator [Actinokineospora enzanensis]|uniref:LuxR C-terminal-related transcriptional regulator n=1 Tax=Actinokineospora enzanensis TaxID=155975 RepID=UPI00036E367F|nr:response regulator transcription factor [Actinokineospora enzanensis]